MAVFVRKQTSFQLSPNHDARSTTRPGVDFIVAREQVYQDFVILIFCLFLGTNFLRWNSICIDLIYTTINSAT